MVFLLATFVPMSDFSEGEDDVFIKYEGDDASENKAKNNNSSSEDEIDVAAVERWVPLGEEKEINETAIDGTSRQDR